MRNEEPFILTIGDIRNMYQRCDKSRLPALDLGATEPRHAIRPVFSEVLTLVAMPCHAFKELTET